MLVSYSATHAYDGYQGGSEGVGVLKPEHRSASSRQTAGLGLVEKQVTGDYVLAEEVKVGILRFFTHMGRFIVPRYLFYSVLFTTMLSAYVVLFALGHIPVSLYALVFGLVGLVIFWVETVRLWRAKPC